MNTLQKRMIIQYWLRYLTLWSLVESVMDIITLKRTFLTESDGDENWLLINLIKNLFSHLTM